MSNLLSLPMQASMYEVEHSADAKAAYSVINKMLGTLGKARARISVTLSACITVVRHLVQKGKKRLDWMLCMFF